MFRKARSLRALRASGLVAGGSKEACSALARLYASAGGANYVGEPVSLLEHALQAAALARRSGAGTEVVVAALLHDVGHLRGAAAGLPQMRGDLGAQDHERVGAEYLAELGLNARVCHLVRAHVQAKRFLCWRSPRYLQRLSPASAATLALQGGPMDDAGAAAFRGDPDCRVLLRLRAWDEAAKRPSVPGLWRFPTYEPLIAACVRAW
jgi:2-amino-1-hydroxyethylphosphonate dioxygenase (glycine-forming)